VKPTDNKLKIFNIAPSIEFPHTQSNKLSDVTNPLPDTTDCEGDTVDDHEKTEFDCCEMREITLIEIRMIIRLKLSL
jgi:hypothetical protein